MPRLCIAFTYVNAHNNNEYPSHCYGKHLFNVVVVSFHFKLT